MAPKGDRDIIAANIRVFLGDLYSIFIYNVICSPRGENDTTRNFHLKMIVHSQMPTICIDKLKDIR